MNTNNYVTSVRVQAAVGVYRSINRAVANGYGTATQHIAARYDLIRRIDDLTEDEHEMYCECIASLPPEVIYGPVTRRHGRGPVRLAT